jgi:hypothetical protein
MLSLMSATFIRLHCVYPSRGAFSASQFVHVNSFSDRFRPRLSFQQIDHSYCPHVQGELSSQWLRPILAAHSYQSLETAPCTSTGNEA